MLTRILGQSTPTASTIFYLTLLFIFISAIVTTILAKWARDKCLKFFREYRVTLERFRGQTLWGELKVFSSGIEVTYDHPHVDPQGRKKTSYLFYQPELEQQVLCLFRIDQHLSEAQRQRRHKQIRQTFNP